MLYVCDYRTEMSRKSNESHVGYVLQHMPKKVLFLITKSNWGGAQRYVFDLTTALNTDNHHPIVALGGNGALKIKLNESGIDTVTLHNMENTLSVAKLISATKETILLLKNEKPDILHCNSSIAGFVGVLAGRIVGINAIIFTAHGWAFNEDRSVLQKIIFKFTHWLTVLLSHQTIAVSEATKEQLNWPTPRNRLVVIHNGRKPIDFIDKIAAREKLNLPLNKVISCTIGELHPVKQHDVMIHSIKKLHDKNIAIHHTIIGAGQQELELKELASSLGVRDYVHFIGALDEASRFLKAFDLYVQPSRSEALAYTVIEASFAELPIIASDVGGIPEIITNTKNGLLVQSGDAGDLAEKIKTLLEDRSISAQYAKEAFIDSNRFSFQNMLEKTLAVYDSTRTS